MADQPQNTAARVMTLRLFNDKATCPKCSGSEVKATYEPPRPSWQVRRVNGESVYSSHSLYGGDLLDGEFIMRTCERCRYQWPEACLDH